MESLDRTIKETLQSQIRSELNERRQITDEEVYDLIDNNIIEYGQHHYFPLREKLILRTELFDSFRRFDILQQIIDNPDVTEIMINGTNQIFIEESGRVKRWSQNFATTEQLEDMVQQMVSQVNRRVNVASPIVDARLPDGSRVHVVLPPVSLGGPIVTIRKFPKAYTMDQLICLNAISADGAQLLKKLVQAGYNIFISGGTNSGKTTFLNALSAYIPKEERVITIEDSAELQIQHVENLVRLEVRNANEEGHGAIGIGDLIKATLRMNPSGFGMKKRETLKPYP